MARRQITTIHDDLDGTEGATTVKFGLDGKNYEIDLSEVHERELREALEKYLAAATLVRTDNVISMRRQSATAPASSSAGKKREWLREQGIVIGDRGRIPTELMGLYNKYGAYGHPLPADQRAHFTTPPRQEPLPAISAPVGNPLPIELPAVAEASPKPEKKATTARKAPAPRIPPATDKKPATTAKKTAAKPPAKKPTTRRAA